MADSLLLADVCMSKRYFSSYFFLFSSDPNALLVVAVVCRLLFYPVLFGFILHSLDPSDRRYRKLFFGSPFGWILLPYFVQTMFFLFLFESNGREKKECSIQKFNCRDWQRVQFNRNCRRLSFGKRKEKKRKQKWECRPQRAQFSIQILYITM